MNGRLGNFVVVRQGEFDSIYIAPHQSILIKTYMFLFSLFGLFAVVAWIYLALAHGFFWRILLPGRDPAPQRFPSVDIVVPAR